MTNKKEEKKGKDTVCVSLGTPGTALSPAQNLRLLGRHSLRLESHPVVMTSSTSSWALSQAFTCSDVMKHPLLDVNETGPILSIRTIEVEETTIFSLLMQVIRMFAVYLYVPCNKCIKSQFKAIQGRARFRKIKEITHLYQHVQRYRSKALEAGSSSASTLKTRSSRIHSTKYRQGIQAVPSPAREHTSILNWALPPCDFAVSWVAMSTRQPTVAAALMKNHTEPIGMTHRCYLYHSESIVWICRVLRQGGQWGTQGCVFM